jgi:uncharacterized membrane protein (TIGR02234 family)
MTSGEERRLGGARTATRSDRRWLMLTIVLGAAGAGLVFLASRQGWAQVRTVPPKPLPASQVTVTGSALVSYSSALVLAGLATLGAVLASRRLARRLTGVLLALIGASLAASAFTVTTAAAISAASSNVGPATAGAGSVTNGSGQPTSIPNVAGTAPHVTFSTGGWQALVVVGALAMIVAGVLVAWRADRMAVMSGRYDSPTGGARRTRPASAGSASAGSMPAGAVPAGPVPAGPVPAGPVPAGPVPAGPVPAGPASAGSAESGSALADSASIWEALSRGDDPTVVDTGSQKA